MIPTATATAARALVTGATSDVGLAVVRRLRGAGADVVALVRPSANVSALEDLGATAVPIDLGDTGAVHDLTRACAPFTTLVHAATTHPSASFTLDAAEAHAAWAVGVASFVVLARAVRSAGGGRVVAIGSAAGTIGSRGHLTYAATKAALVGAVRTLAVELGPRGTTVNLVVPGLLDTRRTREAVPAPARLQLESASALQRSGSADEVAALVAFLCSADAAFITGAVLPVDGGLGLGGGLTGRST